MVDVLLLGSESELGISNVLHLQHIGIGGCSYLDGLTEFEIRLEAGGYITAGSDTAAITLTYLVWAVCKLREAQEKLVAEVASLPEGFTDTDLKKISYLDHVINEALRVYPAVPSALLRAVPQEGAPSLF